MANALPSSGNRFTKAIAAAWSELTAQPYNALADHYAKAADDYKSFPVYAGSGYYDYGSTRNFGRDKYSAARAYHMALHVHDAVSLILSAIDNVPWQIKRYSGDPDDTEGEIVAQQSDILPRHNFQRALLNYKQAYRLGILKRMCASMLLFDETYIELIRPESIQPGKRGRVNGVNWLNPIAVDKNVNAGRIVSYYYNGPDGQTSNTFQLEEIAYEHGYNALSDLNGYSTVQALADVLNVDNRYLSGVLTWLANGLHMGGVITPAGDTVGKPAALRELKDILENQAKGSRNIGRWHLLPVQASITDFGMPEFDKIFAPMSGDIRKQVYASFRIPEAAAGIVDTASFKSGDEVTYRFYQAAVIPLARRISEFINMQLMPLFVEQGQNDRLVYDTSEYDRAGEADRLEADVAARRGDVLPIPVNEQRKAMKLLPDPLLEDYYMVPGVVGPVPKDKVTSIWAAVNNTPAPTLPEPPTTPTVPPTSDPAQETMQEDNLQELDVPEAPLSGESKAHVCGPDCDHTHELPDAVKRQHDELDTWRKAAFNRAEKAADYAFECQHVTTYVSDAIKAELGRSSGNKDYIYDVFAGARDEVAVLWAYDDMLAKSAIDYRRSIRRLARGLWNGDIERSAFISDMTSAIQRAFTDAFNRGLKAEGAVWDSLEDDDKDELQKRGNEELLNLRVLADYIVEESKANSGSLRAVRDRVDLWVRRYDSVYDLGVLVGAGNKRKMWVWTPGKEHCLDCSKMNGRVYTAKIWRKYGILPKSAQLECFGLYCGCGFEDTDEPVTKGRPPALRGPR